MAKLTAWLFTLLGAWLVLGQLDIALFSDNSAWATALIFLVVGVSKLIRNYSK